MMYNNLPYEKTHNSLQITFCGSGSCKCPSIDINKDNDTVIIGGKEEGYTRFTKEQFDLFLETAKNGAFDEFIKK